MPRRTAGGLTRLDGRLRAGILSPVAWPESPSHPYYRPSPSRSTPFRIIPKNKQCLLRWNVTPHKGETSTSRV